MSSAIDITLLEGFAEMHASVYEVAAMLALPAALVKTMLSPDYHDPQYREAWLRGRAKGNIKLRQLQWKHAQAAGSGGVAMTRHLSEHWLGEGADQDIVDTTAPEGARKKDNRITVNVALIPTGQGLLDNPQNGMTIEAESREGFELEDYAAAAREFE